MKKFLFITAISLFLVSCSCEYHYSKLQKNCASFIITNNDTIILPEIHIDTMVRTDTANRILIIDMKTIKNSIKESIIAQIPHNIDERRKFIKQWLNKYVDTKVYCETLQKYVHILPKSIKETAHHASKSKKSTIAALNLKNVIKHATFKNIDKPKIGTQSKGFHFKEILILYTYIDDLGVAKLTIGKDKKNYFIHYCITALQ